VRSAGSPGEEYQVTEKVQETERWSPYRARRGEQRQPVLLKILADGERPDPRVVAQLEHEYQVTARLASPATLRALALERIDGSFGLVLEGFDGVPLRHLMAARLEPERLLGLAIAIAGAVAELHRHQVLHKDLKPESVLVHPVTGEVKLVALGIASVLPREIQPALSPAQVGLVQGTLAYMSPEQTGRMNRAVDQRSDLYALGVTFYEMATGALPFSAADPLEWIHCHLAGVPRPPHDVDPRVPEVLSRMILKLLAKTAEDRYQSALGLVRDLERCLDRWRATGTIAPFALATDDVPEQLQIPQRLYGRERPLGELLQAFERVATEGAPELALVAGSAGVGKSALVRELERPVSARGGFFLYGKIDQLSGEIPCAPFVAAFRERVRDLLAGSDASLAAWRARLQPALGDNGRIMIDVLPELEAIIGAQPAVPELRPSEARARFDRTFLRFIGAFAGREHPVALVLDDLQWVDSGSLNLIQRIAGNGGPRHLLLIGTYRPEEAAATLAELRQAGPVVREMELSPLSAADLRVLLSDALRCREQEAEALAALMVDDDPDIRESMELTLRLDGRTVMAAADGEDALRRMRGTLGLPCVILLDLMMPGMNGFQFMSALRADPALATARVVVITGAGVAVEGRVRELPPDVLRKPVELAALLAVVRRFCGPGSRPRA
jgi:CheY-like chemotaxis protein